MTNKQIGQSVKQRYPQYQDLSDEEVGQKILAKYPQYGIAQQEPQKESAKPERLSFLKKAGKVMSGIGGVVSRALQIPQTLATIQAKTVGGAIGPLFAGKGVSLEQKARTGLGAIKEGIEEYKQIPSEVARGAREGFFKESRMTTPAKELGVKGIPGIAIDIASDPLNLLFAGPARKSALARQAKGKGFLQRTASSMYQTLAKPKGKKEQKIFAQIGREFAEEVPKTLGKRLSHYGISGSFKSMIGKMNKRIGKLSGNLDEAAKVSKAQIPLDDIANKIDDLANTYRAVGQNQAADSLDDILRQYKPGDTISVDDALKLKRQFDDMRLTASGALSEAQSAQQRVYRVISNDLRNKLNDIPEIGKLNAEMSTYYDAIEAFSKQAVKRAAEGKLPIKFTNMFPFIRPNLGMFPRSRSAVARGLSAIPRAEQAFGVAPPVETLFKTVAPQVRRLFQR